jgi:hypothetical protein
MYFAQAVTIVIAGKLASPMVDTLMAVAPTRGSRSNGTINNAPSEAMVFMALESMLVELHLKG